MQLKNVSVISAQVEETEGSDTNLRSNVGTSHHGAARLRFDTLDSAAGEAVPKKKKSSSQEIPPQKKKI